MNLLKIAINKNRIFGLDILRALAILFVIAEHGELLFPERSAFDIKHFILDGVSLFFVLSGFLIGSILIKEVQKNNFNGKLIFNFWIRRWMRTVPNYFVVLTVVILIHIVFVNGFETGKFTSYFIFSQNLFTEHPHFFPEAWSLSVEEWFYLLLPISLFLVFKISRISIDKAILTTVILTIIGITCYRYYKFEAITVDSLEIWDRSFRKQVFTRLDSIMYGVLGAFLFLRYEKLWNKYRIHFFFTGLAIILLYKVTPHVFHDLGMIHCVFSFSIESISILLLIPFLYSIKTGNGILFKSITFISLISYSMYLVNYTIVQNWIIRKVDWSFLRDFSEILYTIVIYLAYWGITVLLSVLLYKCIETPFMRLRNRISPK